jgi:polar amino acid transport system permease protein
LAANFLLQILNGAIMDALTLIIDYLFSELYLRAAGMTLLLTVVAMFFGMLVGLIIAVIQETENKQLNYIVTTYIWFFRGTPALFQIIFIYNVLPEFGINLSSFTSGALALALHEGAYISEIMRAGLQSVGKGQRNAARSVGMKEWQVMRYIILPQAIRVIIPPIGNQFIGMLKLSALVSVVAVEELLLVANQAASSNFLYLEALTAAGIYYLVFTTIFMYIQGHIEHWANGGHRPKTSVEDAPNTNPLGGTEAR